MPEPQHPSAPKNGVFPTTHWSLIRRAGTGTEADVQAALAALCQAYWYPLYAYVRRRGYAVHDAQDLTQSFVIDLIEGPILSRADPDKGRFRSFVLGSLRYFLANENRRQDAERRGGRAVIFSIEESRAESWLSAGAAHHQTPEAFFEHAWAFALLDAVLVRIRAEFERT